MASDSSKKKPRLSPTLYEAFDFAVVRAPLLPMDTYVNLGARAPAPEGAVRLAPADPEIRRALAIGSPSLLESLDRTAPESDKAPALLGKLRRFLIRMSTRPTPYGTFAGVALAGWGERTDASLGAPRTRTRVDMDWLVRYVLALEKQASIRTQLQWVANSSVWFHHDRALKGAAGVVSIAATSVVRQALALTRTPIRYADLHARLVESSPAATPHKVEHLLTQLWELGFVRTDLMPPVTIVDPIRWVRERVAPIMGGKSLCVQLDALLATIDACDSVPVEEVPHALKKATSHVELLGSSDTKMPLQVDMALGLDGGRLTSAIAEEAGRMADLLFSLAPRRMRSGLEGYRQAFVAKYGSDREVPILEVLHPEWGLGFPGPQHHPSGGKSASGQVDQRAEALQYLALRAARDGQRVLDLDEPLLERLRFQRPRPSDLPASIDLNLFVLAESRAALDAGAFQLLLGPNVGSVDAGRSLGRFAALLGSDARGALERVARHDEERRPGPICAELTFMPRKYRGANVTIRPAVRRYEITHGVSAAVDAENVVPLNELAIVVRDNRFHVRWVPRGVDVVVSWTHMLHLNQGPEEYQLLWQISRDSLTMLGPFDWGPAAGFAFLPRVQSGRSILSCAQWHLEAGSRGEAPVEKPAAFADWFARWRDRWLVPRRVYLTSSDNRLLYDLDDPACVEELRGELVRGGKRSDQCLLQEALPGPEHAWLPSARGGHHIVELAVSLGLRSEEPKQEPQAPRKTEALPSRPVASELRLRPPGSDWLYLKLHGPKSGEDELLAGTLRALCRDTDWFFLRYADPERHLRLRFRASPEHLRGALFPEICAWASKLVADGRCQKFAFDTYDREIERYGGAEAILAAEDLFVADSRAAADLLAATPKVDLVLRAVVAADDLLASLGLGDESARLAWLKTSVDSRKEVSDEYRERGEKLVAALRAPGELGPGVSEIFQRRRAALLPIADRLAALERDRMLTQPREKLYHSYLHMLCNRLGADPAAERRVRGLLLRGREAIAHRTKGAGASRPETTTEPGSRGRASQDASPSPAAPIS